MPANTGAAGARHCVAFFAGAPAPTGMAPGPGVGVIPVKAMASAKGLEACTVGVGAGMPANTGAAGARHCVAFFAGAPAPTGIAPGPRVGVIPVKAMASVKDLEACTVGVGAGMPANTGTAGAMHCVAFFAGEPAPTGIAPGPRVGVIPVKAVALAKDREACTVDVGAGMPANTGAAGARHCVAFFAGAPAPTGIAPGPGLARLCAWLRLASCVLERFHQLCLGHGGAPLDVFAARFLHQALLSLGFQGTARGAGMALA